MPDITENPGLQEFWTDIQDARFQTSAWDLTQTVSQETMQEIINEVHRRAPTKQNRVAYSMHLFDWSNTQIRDDFWEMAVDRDNPDPKFNPQTLANWLVVFSTREPQPFRWDFTQPPDGTVEFGLSTMEIGMAAHMLIYSARAKGLQCGFCKCLNWDDPRWDSSLLAATGASYPEEVQLLVGVGVINSDLTTTYNPHTDTWIDVTKEIGQKWLTEPKPDQSEYVHWHV